MKSHNVQYSGNLTAPLMAKMLLKQNKKIRSKCDCCDCSDDKSFTASIIVRKACFILKAGAGSVCFGQRELGAERVSWSGSLLTVSRLSAGQLVG